MNWIQRLFFPGITRQIERQIAELNRISDTLKNRKPETVEKYTITRVFNYLQPEYYGWMKDLVDSEQYKFMIYELMETIKDKMLKTNDEKLIYRFLGQLDMFSTVDIYLKASIQKYETQIRRNTEKAEN
jgi:hypothetical protein